MMVFKNIYQMIIIKVFILGLMKHLMKAIKKKLTGQHIIIQVVGLEFINQIVKKIENIFFVSEQRLIKMEM